MRRPTADQRMQEILNERDRTFLQASIFQIKSSVNMGLMPDITTVRFVTDMAQRMMETVVFDPQGDYREREEAEPCFTSMTRKRITKGRRLTK
ncbi:hypothetical protein, partial [Staphylococcus aureus]|uniref:hypothetical protein n=1 Tax=Staphylococcus aureus TaxID=1280 RepID=UPI0020BF9E3A